MALTNQEWSEIAVLYKMGEKSIREVAKQFGITHGAIQDKAKREKWQRGSIKNTVNQLAKQTSQISHLITEDEAPIINQIIKDKTELSNLATEIVSDSMQLQQSIVKGTLHKLQTGVIDELQASKVLQSLGLTFDSIREMFNMDKNVRVDEDRKIVLDLVGTDDKPEQRESESVIINIIGI